MARFYLNCRKIVKKTSADFCQPVGFHVQNTGIPIFARFCSLRFLLQVKDEG